MEFSNSTAYGKLIGDSSFELRRSSGENREAILWVSFNPAHQSLNVGAMDYAEGEYSHRLSAQPSHHELQSFLAAVEEHYGVKIPRFIKRSLSHYVSILPEIRGILLDLDDEPSDCEYCGLNPNRITAYYVPPFEASGEDSLVVNYSFGCYGWSRVAGPSRSVGKEALEILDGASGNSPEAMEELQDFRAELAELLEEPSENHE